MSLENINLRGKTALVTGGARRIGRAVALSLAAEGVNVVVHYSGSSREAEKTVRDIRQAGVNAWKVKADFSDPARAEKMFAAVMRLAGRVDFLINNASEFLPSRLDSMTRGALFRSLDINAIAPLILARHFADHARTGSIINMLDCRIGEYDLAHAAYQLSKNMLRDITLMLAIAYAPRIRVNAVAPGIILPPQGKSAAYLKKTFYRNLLGREGSASGIADAVLFLLRNSFITGEVLFVDGGENLKSKNYSKK